MSSSGAAWPNRVIAAVIWPRWWVPWLKTWASVAANWGPLIASWPDERFDGSLDYRSTQGVAHSLPFAATLAHVFNHGTHHRGQITAAITRFGHPAPELDLVWMLQQERAAG